VYGYTQMGNHFHLVIETLEATLSTGMRQLNGVYAQWFNRRHGRVGHLFQGRFYSELVEREPHLLEVTRYVVLNPVRARMVAEPVDWPWSSYRATIGANTVPVWLDVDWTLSHFGGSMRRYADFVAEGRRSSYSPRALRGRGACLGSDRFRRLVGARAEATTRAPEIPIGQRCRVPTPIGEAIPRLLSHLHLTHDELRQPRHRFRERSLVAFALRRFSRATGTTIAPLLGVTAWQAARMARRGESDWPSAGLPHLGA
jgi:putative transposase